MVSSIVGAAAVEISMDLGAFAEETKAKLAAAFDSPALKETVTAGLDKAAEGAGESGRHAAQEFATGVQGGTADLAEAGAKAGEGFSTGAAEGIKAGSAEVAAAADTSAAEVGAGARDKMAESGAEAGGGFRDGMLDSLKGLASAALPMVAAFGGAELIKGAVEAADQMEGANQKIENVFGQSGAAVQQWAGSVSGSLRISAQAAETQAGTIGAYLSGLGVSKTQAAGLSEQVVGLTQNMAAFNNADPAAVQSALASAMRGRTTALKAYGVTLNANAPLEALQARGVKLTGDAMKDGQPVLTAQQKSLGTLYAVMDATKNQQTGLAQTSDTMKAHQQVLSAEIDNFRVKLGDYLLPILAKLTGYIVTTVIPALIQFGDWFELHILPVIKEVADYVDTHLLPVIQKIGDWMQKNGPTVFTFVGVLLAVAGAVKLWAIAQGLLNFAMDANPIVLVGLAIAALAAGLVYAYEHSETFRKIVDEIGKVLKTVWDTVLKPVADFLMDHWKAALEIALLALAPFIGIPLIIITHWHDIENFFTGLWADIKNIFSDVINEVVGIVKGWYPVILGVLSGGVLLLPALIFKYWSQITGFIARAWNDAITWMQGLEAKILNIFKDALTWLEKIGEDIMNGLWGGIKSIWNKEVAAWENIGTTIKDWFKDAITWLEQAGEDLINGLIKGIEHAGAKVAGAVNSIIKKVPGASAVESVGGDIASVFAGGGWTKPGAPSYALMHPDEYVLSEAMLQGKQTIDPTVLAAVYSITGGAGNQAQAQGASTRPLTVNNYNTHQAGTDLSSFAADVSRRTARSIRAA